MRAPFAPPLLLALLLLAACGGAGAADAPPAAAAMDSVGATDTLSADGAPPAGPATAVAACVPPGATLTGDGVGEVRIGRSVAELRGVCSVVRDTVVPGPEGMPQRVLEVPTDGDTLRVEVVDDAVWRVTVTDDGVRTVDGRGVGARLGDLAALDGVRGDPGEGGMYVTLPGDCGISYRLPSAGTPPAGGGWTAAQLRRLPADARVEAVLLTGCDP